MLNKSTKNLYKKLSKNEFDLCELAIAKQIQKTVSRIGWHDLANGKKIEYLEGARRIILEIENYYELIPTYWKETKCGEN